MSTSDLVQLAGAIGGLLSAIVGAAFWLLQRRIKQLDIENKRLRAQGASLKDEKTRLELEYSHQSSTIKRFTDEAEDARRRLRHAEESLGVFRTENAELRAKHAVLEAQVARLNVQLAEQTATGEVIRRERDRYRGEAESLQHQLGYARTELTTTRQQLKRAEERSDDLEQQLHTRVAAHQKDVEERDEKIQQLSQEREDAQKRAEQAETSNVELTAQLEQLNNQIEQVIKQDERVWERPVVGVPFQPLSRREVPIIAVLNLKGGVGKTTITTNLAGLMAQQGKKVLVIDADYQRNLSMLLVADKDRKVLHLERRTLQHFLSDARHSLTSFLYAASEVSAIPNCWAVTNSDALKPADAAPAPALQDIGLGDVEIRLMAKWMFRRVEPDVRLYLREALHDLRLKEKGYHYVLIDCPPRLSTACINALAASDFFLVPVLLDAVCGRSVPNLLRTLRRLHSDHLFPELRCLGVLANNVTLRNEKPIDMEAKIWSELPTVCQVAWESNVHLFKTMVPRNNLLRKAAGRIFGADPAPALALTNSEINGVFKALLKEIETRIEHECQCFAAVPPKPALGLNGG